MLVRQILVKSEAQVDHWRHALLGAMGPNGQLMANLIPEVEFVIGKQRPVAELPPQEARGRFQLVFRSRLPSIRWRCPSICDLDTAGQLIEHLCFVCSPSTLFRSAFGGMSGNSANAFCNGDPVVFLEATSILL
jgi:hypothetical protein